MAKATYNNKNNQFYNSLKLDIDAYFTTNNLKKTGGWRMYFKAILLITIACTIYSILMFTNLAPAYKIVLCMLLGINSGVIGFSIMHDANHGAISSKKWVNDLMGLTINCLGANAYFWKQKHNILHHTYTNVDGLDDDIAKSPIIRQCESQRWVPAHKLQHYYMFLVYCFASLFWICFMDFEKYFTRKINGTALWEMKPINHLVFWCTKGFYALVYFAIPIYLFGVGTWAAGFFIMHATLGLTLALVFQLAHVVESTHFQQVGATETKAFEISWAEHEVRSCSNFAMSNPVVCWLTGGLNFQTEHHLFPRICHVHYPAMSKIVAAKCKEFGLPYNSYPTMISAIASHFRFMRYLGVNPPAAIQLTAAEKAA
jgi:linoleoyl-CoA desaturase